MERRIRGITVPGELSVVGFDDLPMSAFTVPALTTIRMPVREMATRAVQIAIDGTPRGGSPIVEVLRPELVVRRSTAAVVESPIGSPPPCAAEGLRASTITPEVHP